MLMNTLIAASLAAIAAATVFGDVQRDSKPPQPYNDKVVLPGKVPPTAKSVGGSWQYSYSLHDAPLESGRSDLVVGTVLTLNEDGSYRLHYHARWNFPRAPIPIPGQVPMPLPVPTTPSGGLDGVNVSEDGRYVLSGQVLLLEPEATRLANLDNNRVVNERTLENEKHVLIVRLDKTQLAAAGRCASYQVDPVCKTTPLVWYTMKAQLGRRWLGIEPR
jgi:hypothetical protein